MKRNKILQIVLTDKQRKTYESIVRKGMSSAAEIRRANVLLLADESGERKKQTDAILEMKLRRLTGLERDKIENELAELRKRISFYKAVLAALDVMFLVGAAVRLKKLGYKFEKL